VASAFRRKILLAATIVASGCSGEPAKRPAASVGRPSILLITLDTTRADSIGIAARSRVDTDTFNALEGQGRRYTQAYATVPETLPSHTSMMTGLYPGGHGVHQNARYVSSNAPLLAEQLQGAGYHTAAFVSAFVLKRRFGLSRGFDVYDDGIPAGRNEPQCARDDRCGDQELLTSSTKPRFLWVHYYDPHAPYDTALPRQAPTQSVSR
jgi:hypothetical protein